MQEFQPGNVNHGYEFMEALGRGAYSSVYKVRSLRYDALFVAKVAHIVDGDVDRAWSAFDSEVQALMRLDHPCIIKLYEHFRCCNNFVMILEYCPMGSLEDYIKGNGRMQGAELLNTVRDICSALNYAWSVGVQHRDIKPANILFNKQGRACLADFGISLMSDEFTAPNVDDFRCSLVCAAPEIVLRVPHDPIKSDMWAMGVTILWMAHGDIPWSAKSSDDLKTMIRYANYIFPKRFDPNLAKIVKGMMTLAPDHRVFPTVEELSELVAMSQAGAPAINRVFMGTLSVKSVLNNQTVLRPGPLRMSASLIKKRYTGPLRRGHGNRVGIMESASRYGVHDLQSLIDGDVDSAQGRLPGLKGGSVVGQKPP